jgi:hypothetical protein
MTSARKRCDLSLATSDLGTQVAGMWAKVGVEHKRDACVGLEHERKVGEVWSHRKDRQKTQEDPRVLVIPVGGSVFLVLGWMIHTIARERSLG